VMIKLSPSIHKFGDELIYSGLSSEWAMGNKISKNTSSYLRIEALSFKSIKKP
jgi:hypothetical protein